MERFIDPKTLARIKDMPLIAKTVADGFLHGVQASTQRGVGVEFNQYRAYEPGDELSRIDWKLFARSDRYFVREAERESEIEVWFLLDASASMLQSSQSATSSNWNKFDYSKHLIASLAYLAQKQGDSCGYIGLSTSELLFLPAGMGERHWRKVLHALHQTQSGEFFPQFELVKNYLSQVNKKVLMFIISDLHQRDNEIIEFVNQLNGVGSEVIALQPLCRDEMEFNYSGAIRFKDLETHQEVLVSAANIKENYLSLLENYQSQLHDKLLSRNISRSIFDIDLPLDFVLYEYLKHRTQNRG